MKQLMEGLGKAVKEVTVTVMYRPKTASKTIEYSVTTYFVDYDKDISFAFPGMGAMGAGGGASGGGAPPKDGGSR